MKKILILMSVLFISGCVNDLSENGTNNPSPEPEVTTVMEEQSSQAEETSDEESLVKELEDKRGLRMAKTDYSAYAQPNEEGYAFEVFSNPKITSEIYPKDENSSQDILLFTFDDAPQMPDSYALDIAKKLKALDVNAIFLVNGMYLETEEGRQITKDVYDLGFEIGNHTQHHPYLTDLSYEGQYEEILRTNELIEEITGDRVRWFRPPFGMFNDDTLHITNELGLQLMNWSFGYDWQEEYLSGPALAAVSLDNQYLRGGANILMHDRSWTLDALDEMVAGYRQMGYHIVDPYLIEEQASLIVNE